MAERAPVFLERRRYRARRMMDAVRLLAFLGIALWMVPLMWGVPGDGGAPMPMSAALRYIFGVWVVMVVVGLVLYRRTPMQADDRPTDGGS
ncbi:hypothetical protein H9Q16_03095 [Sulfitobacter sp. TSTF-M16]|uniref:Uncharacterized protein n=1 Tax=Sulfitobacter aestuariivivens TaxID=2766981 RepID=A0A927D0N7_9RHOB|nr:hypothetical protein [Sulfitobacter aestuariivivens]MBD3662898.1 hypothetical protein [Sulfitobacter aestuariivivens]